MASGEPLNDEDRFPWLNIVRNAAVKTCSVEDAASHETGVVIACSALKRSYRGLLRGITGDEVHVNSHSKLPTYFGFIQGPKEVLFERMSARKNHFMKAKMLDSQIATLEDPSGEDGVFIINLVDNPEQQTQRALETLAKWGVQPARASHPERDQVGHGVPVDIDTENPAFTPPLDHS
ncbi:hypothetical protein BKA62DRAFT_703294 [Auriculariales sp. MPI-PUGE-AT-0066]|nr:hypothetical protein BKA62DRAFT_703294 [Auriculariales sp. MPI-PUGE-AT-0066]